MKTLYFITSNKGKVAEVQAKLRPLSLKISQKNLGYPELQVDTLEEVVRYGLEYLNTKVLHPLIIEDAGLFIHALNGFPGVYSKHVYYTIGCQGVLKLLRNVEERSALFRSVYGYIDEESTPRIFVGKCTGSIALEEKGEHGFGYDPIFIPKEDSRTFAEMTIDEKNMFSHRGKAVEQLIGFFKEKMESSPSKVI